MLFDLSLYNMMARGNLTTLILLLGVLKCVEFSSANKKCSGLKTLFSNVYQNFMGCAIKNAEPVTYCRKCGSDDGFSAVNIKYKELVANEECKAEYFSQDRINIIEMIYSNAQSVWEAGSCSNCYDWVEGNIHQNESETTTKFFNELANFTYCLDQSDEKTICSNCVDNYNSVNGLYKNIQRITNDNLCFDIKDAMNKTRLNWSHNLKCCKDRKTSLTAFIVTSSVISVLIPFVFYTSFMFFGWRRDQLQEPLIDSDIQPSSSRQMIETDERSSCVPAITNLLDME